MSDRSSSIRERLEAHDQAQLLRFYDELDAQQQAALLDQIEGIDLDAMDELIRASRGTEERSAVPAEIGPCPYYSFDPDAMWRSKEAPVNTLAGAHAEDGARDYDSAEMRAAGEALIRGGKVAAFMVAGGQGTRLGWNGPKGTYPATGVTGKPLFRCFAEQLVAAQKKYGVTIPWYIMTSPVNDEATRSFFLDNNDFGLLRKNIAIFPQGMLPSVDSETGRMLLAQKHEVAVSPDGHGGSIRMLRASGAVEDMRGRGIEHVSYFQVDNPLVRVIDPLFIGLHAKAPDSSAEMSSKMVPKVAPEEPVGVFVRSGGKTMVIEYSDLPDEVARDRDPDGGLRYVAGSIAIHLLGVEFVERLTADEHRFALPYHFARKKTGFVDLETGVCVEPEKPNSIKFETFIFDALPLAASSIVYETDRIEEFAPIKNASGSDSPASSHQLQYDRAGRWLAAHGVEVLRGRDGHVSGRIEISPLTALEPADLVAVDLPGSITEGEEVVL